LYGPEMSSLFGSWIGWADRCHIAKVERELLDDLKRVTDKRQSNLDPFKLALVKTELEDRVDRRLFSRA
jgi:hypothetical protein